jgi:CelD/BcsL family acetyltransferase involved in cellulose biosynthesis
VSRVQQREELPKAFDTLVDLHEERWRVGGRKGVFADSRFTSFHREMAEEALERGWLRLSTLTLGDGRAVVSNYGFRYRTKEYLYQQGVAPDLYRFNCGLVLLSEDIRSALEEGCAEYDFLRGTADYKLHWSKALRSTRTFWAARSSLAGRLYAARISAVRSQAIRRVARRCLPRVIKDRYRPEEG